MCADMAPSSALIFPIKRNSLFRLRFSLSDFLLLVAGCHVGADI